MTRKWKLLKDTLAGSYIIEAGTIFQADPYDPGWAKFSWGGHCQQSYSIEFVEAHPEWFEEIKPRRVLFFSHGTCNHKPRRVLVIETPATRVNETPCSITLHYRDADVNRINNPAGADDSGNATFRIEERE